MPITILDVVCSPLQNKRFRIFIKYADKIKHYDFGLNSGSTYIDHKDKKKREAYRKRHYANESEKRLIDNFIPSPALFSYKLLWGENTDFFENLNKLQADFNKK